MGIFDKRKEHETSVISNIGRTVVDVISLPFDFAKEVVKTPFNFVSSTVGGVTTKVVLIVGLAVLGVFVIGKYNILGQAGKLK
jgi:hypothetical protein